MRAALLILLFVSCAPRTQQAPCNDARECAPDDACVLGTCRPPLLLKNDDQLSDPPPVDELDVEQLTPRATSQLVALLAPDERSGHSALLHLDEGPRAASDPRYFCGESLTIEAFTASPLDDATPLVSADGHTLVGVKGARHHALTVSGDVARRYQNGGFRELAAATVDDDERGRVELLSGELSLVAVYCRALSHREIQQNARFSDTLPTRTARELVVRYPFAGDRLFADEGPGEALDLVPVGETALVNGGVYLAGARLDGGFAPKIEAAIASSRAFTLEMWVAPDDTDEAASFLSSRPGQGESNFTLGLEDGRVMASARDTRFLDAPASGLSHLVLTHDGSELKLYRDGALTQTRTSDALVFRTGRFGIGSELTGERAFFGALYDVAIFSQALSADEIQAHHLSGPGATE